MDNVLNIIKEYKIVPVIKIDTADHAKALGQALINGGLPLAEITFRTDAAAESIRTLKKEYPDMLVGAGSLINDDQAKLARVAGADFFVSAGFSREIADYADKTGIPYFAGCATATEIIKCVVRGYKVVKFFPAAQIGGVEMIKALAAPFPGLKFMPTGGINASNVKEYLDCDKVIACGGSWVVDSKLIANEKFDEIEKLVKEAIELTR